jgi:hypothetical protein
MLAELEGNWYDKYVCMYEYMYVWKFLELAQILDYFFHSTSYLPMC